MLHQKELHTFVDLLVLLKIMEWKLLDDTLSLDPIAWFWKFDNGSLAPVHTDKDVAPPSILKAIAKLHPRTNVVQMFVHARIMA